METELQRAKLADFYTRFPALTGPGPSPDGRLNGAQIGCFLSHCEVVCSAAPDGTYVHILEDDAVISPHLAPLLHEVIPSGRLDNFDMVYLDMMIMLDDRRTIGRLKPAYDAAIAAPVPRFSLIDLRNLKFFGATSYVVTPAGRSRMKAAFARALAGGTPQQALDVFYLDEIRSGRLRAVCVFPFLTSVDGALSRASTIGAQDVAFVYDLLRYAFYAGFDLARARKRLPAFRSGGPDSHDAYLTDVLRFI